jgi:hypothetical protein
VWCQNFQGTSGKAYLFDSAYVGGGCMEGVEISSDSPWGRVNVCTGPPEERVLMTGLHVVVDLYCNTCRSPVGWKYVRRARIAML